MRETGFPWGIPVGTGWEPLTPHPLTQTAPDDKSEAEQKPSLGETPGRSSNALCPRQDSNLRHPL